MIGVCINWDFEQSIGWVQNEQGDFFVHFSQITEDNLGRRYLLVGEDAEFDIGADQQGRACATEVRPLTPREEDDPATYWEEGYVERVKHPPYGAIIKRPAGGWIFLHKDNAKTRIAFAKEQVWRYRVAPPLQIGLNWLAVDAEFLGMLDG